MAVAELAKTPGASCAHCLRAKGCAIYDSRPAGCRDFYCEWMLSEKLGREWKPDRARFALMQTATGHLAACVDPDFPSAWKRSPYQQALRRWARERAEDPSSSWPGVDVWIGQRCIILLPDGEKDLGIVAADEEVRIDHTMTERGPAYFAEKFTVPAAGAPRPTHAPPDRGVPPAPPGNWLRRLQARVDAGALRLHSGQESL